MIVQIGGVNKYVEVSSIFLNIAAFLTLVASFEDGVGTLAVAVLIWILDELKYPHPIIMNVIEEGDGGEEPPITPS